MRVRRSSPTPRSSSQSPQAYRAQRRRRQRAKERRRSSIRVGLAVGVSVFGLAVCMFLSRNGPEEVRGVVKVLLELW